MAELSITDLHNIVKVMDYAAEQGAFKGWEVIEQVQTLRNKVKTFVEASKAEQAAFANEERHDG